MSRRSLFFLFGLFTVTTVSGVAMFGLFRRKPPTDTSPVAVQDAWSVAQGEREGRPMFVRLNTGLLPLRGKPPCDHRIGVAVPLLTPNEHGLPTPQETDALNQIEDALCAAFATTPAQTHLAVVVTTGGMREFVFYTSTADAAPVIDQLQPKVAPHQLQFYVESDRSWSTYRSFQF